jgi:hypothetical protein
LADPRRVCPGRTVVNFYDRRFNILLSDQQEADLVAFMNTLSATGAAPW